MSRTVEPELIDEVPIVLPLSSPASLRPLRPISTAGWPDIDTMPSLAPLPPCSMNAMTALQVLCMMLSEPDATACWPGETPIETTSISTPAAAKKPFRVATTPGHSVAVGDTWPKLTRSAAPADTRPETAMPASAATAAPSVADTMRRCARAAVRGMGSSASPGSRSGSGRTSGDSLPPADCWRPPASSSPGRPCRRRHCRSARPACWDPAARDGKSSAIWVPISGRERRAGSGLCSSVIGCPVFGFLGSLSQMIVPHMPAPHLAMRT